MVTCVSQIPRGYLRLDGPAGECVACASLLQYTAGESLVDGRNHWYLETRCPGCGFETLACGRDRVPRPTRDKLLELTGHWVATIEGAAGVPVMRTLRKIYGCTIAQAREEAERMHEYGLPGTHGELLYLQDQLAAFGVDVTAAMSAPGTQDRLPDRRIPDPPRRIGFPPRTWTSLMPGTIAEPERSQVAAYLRDADCVVATTSGYCVDPITRDPRDRIRDVVMTDGEYIWSLAWATLVERHGVRPPTDLLHHARALGFRPPKLTTQQLHQVAANDGMAPPEEQ